MKKYENGISIKNWAEEDRPREKLIEKGKNNLSNAELIAILIGSGNKKESAVDLSKAILDSVQNNLIELARLSINDLGKFNGIGSAKALNIIAALELGNRRRGEKVLQKFKISSSNDAFELGQSLMSDAIYEEFWIFLLNRANRLMKKINISEGGISGTVADPKKIFKMAIENQCSSIIMCHNHPSGNTRPSEADIRLTRKMKEAGNLLDVAVLDHIIIGHEAYFSFADEGMI